MNYFKGIFWVPAAWLGLRQGKFTCVGWRLTQLFHMAGVRCSAVGSTSHQELYAPLTFIYMFPFVLLKIVLNSTDKQGSVQCPRAQDCTTICSVDWRHSKHQQQLSSWQTQSLFPVILPSNQPRCYLQHHSTTTQINVCAMLTCTNRVMYQTDHQSHFQLVPITKFDGSLPGLCKGDKERTQSPGKTTVTKAIVKWNCFYHSCRSSH